MNTPPDIAPGKYLVLFVDSNTGILLNKAGNYRTNRVEEYYHLFNDLTEAVAFVKEKMAASVSVIEAAVYDSDGNVTTLDGC
jgi:hypothetical protein